MIVLPSHSLDILCCCSTAVMIIISISCNLQLLTMAASSSSPSTSSHFTSSSATTSARRTTFTNSIRSTRNNNVAFAAMNNGYGITNNNQNGNHTSSTGVTIAPSMNIDSSSTCALSTSTNFENRINQNKDDRNSINQDMNFNDEYGNNTRNIYGNTNNFDQRQSHNIVTDYDGAGTLGDIMSEEQNNISTKNDNYDNLNHYQSKDKVVTKEDNDTFSYFPATTIPSTTTKNNHNNNDPSSVLKTKSTIINPSIQNGLVTSTGGTLAVEFVQSGKIPNLTPLERIALTANGNLQRIFSSFYDAPVHVHIDYCNHLRKTRRMVMMMTGRREEDVNSFTTTDVVDDKMWERKVTLSVFGQNFCTAKSIIIVHSQECRALIEQGQVGIGQLFRYLDKLPTFTLIDAGRSENGGLWRRYILECDDIITCDIHEEFSPNAWEIQSTQ